MEKFIIKILNNQQIDVTELNTFIFNYCSLMEVPEPTHIELQGIAQLIHMGMFDLNYAVDLASRKKNLNIYRMYNKNGEFMKAYIP